MLFRKRLFRKSDLGTLLERSPILENINLQETLLEQSSIVGEKSCILGEKSSILGKKSSILGEKSSIFGKHISMGDSLGTELYVLGKQIY